MIQLFNCIYPLVIFAMNRVVKEALRSCFVHRESWKRMGQSWKAKCTVILVSPPFMAHDYRGVYDHAQKAGMFKLLAST